MVLYMYLTICALTYVLSNIYCMVNERHLHQYSPDGSAAPANGRAPNTTGADTDYKLIVRVSIFTSNLASGSREPWRQWLLFLYLFLCAAIVVQSNLFYSKSLLQHAAQLNYRYRYIDYLVLQTRRHEHQNGTVRRVCT